MPRHEDLDFPHAPVHCADCWDDQQRGKVLAEMSRANELKEKELNSYDLTEWVEPKPEYRPRYNILPANPTSIGKGGVRVD